MGDEGYLVLAVGPSQYVEMARNLAASIRVMDGRRRICLIHDENYIREGQDAALFDNFVLLPSDPLYPGFMNKIRVFPLSPYERTMFVDADCLLMKRDIDTYWEMARPHFFAITGGRRVSGKWKSVDIAQLLRQEGAPYLVQMNSGVFCFDKSRQAEAFFAGLNDFYIRRMGELGVGLHRGKPAQTDEFYIGLWMGLNGLDSCGGTSSRNSWMVSTWRAFGMSFVPERGISILRKPRRSLMGVPNPIGGWERLSPSFVHFIGLKPARHYRNLSRYFRSRVSVALSA